VNILAIAFCPPTGAIVDHFVQIAIHLSQQVKVSILCPKNLNLEDGNFQKIYYIDYAKERPFCFLSSGNFRLLQEISQTKFDVIFFFSQHILNVPVALLMKHGSQVMWWHEPIKRGRTTFFKHLLYIPHDYILTHKARKIIIACEAMQSLVPSRLINKLSIVNLPLIEIATNKILKSEAVTTVSDLVFFGNIEIYKGLDVLAAALQSLYLQGYFISLKVIGRGNLSQHCPFLLKLASAYPQQITINNNYEPYSIIVASIKGCKAVVLPYLTATGTTTVQLANYYSKPTIASATGCFQNYIVDRETGFLVPPGDVSALAQAIIDLLTVPETAELMGKQAYQYCCEHFHQSSITSRLLEVFRSANQKSLAIK
jgi:glycosyltransferase involved in cell wall biosynthesis